MHHRWFAVYKNARGSRSGVPYLLDVQSELVRTGSRVVVPLIPTKVYGPCMAKLNPVFEIGGAPHVMATSDIAAVDARDLKTVVVDLSSEREAIVSALDFLFQGY